ncbi:MAG: hypothetical protein ABFS86_10270 [Planctomycetota bacterium]
MSRSLALILLVVLVAGCANTGLRGTEPGDMEVRAWESGTWQKDPAAPKPAEGSENFVFTYETAGWRGDDAEPFHRMKTEVRLSYDAEKGEIQDAKITSSEEGNAYRHVCFTPNGPALRIRIITHLDDRSSDLTVIRLEGPAPSTNRCVGVGVGPWEGLNETLDVIFREDGGFEVMRATGAHLAEADIRIERTMSTRENSTKPATAKFPAR